jgi:Na+-transporting NADH:ubiquinone oxidoreductase subunit NqrB
MIRSLDNLLNGVTMYRLLVYYLLALLSVAAIFGAIGWMPYGPVASIVSTLFILTVSLFTNSLFEAVFKAPTNAESTTITALILALIITPALSYHDTNFWWLALWASLLAISSKYIFAIRKKHIFNPVAFGVAMTAFFLNLTASWWIGTPFMLPFVLLGGLIIARKIHRTDLILSFLASAIAMILLSHTTSLGILYTTLYRMIFTTPLMFFTFVMLTEPLTTPPTRRLRIAYGALTGLLFAPFIHIGSLYFTPELSLLAANIFYLCGKPG